MLFCFVCLFTYLLYVYVYENTEVLLSLPAFLQSHALLTLNYKCEMFTLMQPARSYPHSSLLSASHLILSPFSPFSSSLHSWGSSVAFLHLRRLFFPTVSFVGTIWEVSPRSSFVTTFSFGCRNGWPIGHSSETLVQSDSRMAWHISPPLLLFILICFENSY